MTLEELCMLVMVIVTVLYDAGRLYLENKKVKKI